MGEPHQTASFDLEGAALSGRSPVIASTEASEVMVVHIPEIPDWVTWTLALSAVAAGFWRGGTDGRVVAVLVLLQLLNGWVVANPFRSAAGPVLDLATLVACLALVLKGRNYWTIWAAASAVLSLVTIALNLILGLSVWAYYSAQLAWAYVLIASLLLGSLTARRSTVDEDRGSRT